MSIRGQAIKELEEEYTKERAEAMAEAMAKRAKIAQVVPEVATMNTRLAKALQETFSQAARKDIPIEQKQEAARNRVLAIRDSVYAAMEKMGFSKDDLEIHYKCPLCNDTGQIGDTILSPCQCYPQRLAKKISEKFGIPALEGSFQDMRYDVFAEKNVQEYMQRVASFLIKYADAYPDVRRKDIVVTGASGTGKSYLMNSLAKRIVDNGMYVAWFHATDWIRAAKEYHLKGESDLWEAANSAQWLLVDDLGSEPMYDNISVEYLLMMIDERRRKDIGFAITTNLSPEEIEKRYTERVASRMFDVNRTTIIPMKGADLRKRRFVFA